MNENMKPVVTFGTNIEDAQGNLYPVDYPHELVGECPPEKLSAKEALDIGIDISQCKNVHNTSVFSDNEITKMRYENSCGKSLSDSEIPSEMEVPTLQSLREKKITEMNSPMQQLVEFSEIITCNSSENPAMNFDNIPLNDTTDMVAFPQAPLGLPKIFSPAPIDNRKLEVEATEPNESRVGVNIFRGLKQLYHIRSHQGSLYIFNVCDAIYIPLPERDLRYLIYANFKAQIEGCGNMRPVNDAEDFFHIDSSLVVQKKEFLPLAFWGFKNGIYNIYTKKKIVNHGEFFILHVLQSNYDESATCPFFDAYLKSVAAGNLNLVSLLWEVIGYLLSHDTNGKVLFAFIGPKDTGKSLLAKVICEIVGTAHISNLSASDFSGKFDVSGIADKYLNVCMDLPDRALSADAVGKIKSITGNDNIRSDVKYKEPITFIPTARLLFGANALIRTEVLDLAFIERLITVPFLHQIPKDHQDYDLLAKLLLEKDGICQKALLHYKRLIDNHYNFTSIIVPDILGPSLDYRKVIKSFANEWCDFTGQESDKLSSVELYNAYTNFCYGKEIEILKLDDFSEKFKKLYNDVIIKKKLKINGKSINGFTCVKLKGE